jgi:hypothetical protein
MDQKSLDYFTHRERAERAAAKQATCDAARRVHQQLAVAYAGLVRRNEDSGGLGERVIDNAFEGVAAGKSRV